MNLEIGTSCGMKYLDDPHWVAADVDSETLDGGRIDVQLDADMPLPFRDDAFDEVYSGRCIGTHVVREEAFREVVRVTKPGGRIVLQIYEEDLACLPTSCEWGNTVRMSRLEVTQSYPDDRVEGSEVSVTYIKRRNI